MNTNYERDKWYDASETDPQYQGSIYFVIQDGTKFAGTYIGYSQYKSIGEQIFQDGEVSKWFIRDRKSEKVKEETITHRGIEVHVTAKEDIGFYWQACFQAIDRKTYINRESKENAISYSKNRIDELILNGNSK